MSFVEWCDRQSEKFEAKARAIRADTERRRALGVTLSWHRFALLVAGFAIVFAGAVWIAWPLIEELLVLIERHT